MAESLVQKKEGIRISVKVFALVLTLLPFDSYLGAVLPIPLTGILMVSYIITRVGDLYRYNLLNFRMTPTLLFAAYGIFLSIFTFIKVGAAYNILLFYSMIPIYLLGVLGDYRPKEYNLLIKTAPYSALLFIFFNIIHIVVYEGGIYLGIKDICDPNYLMTCMVIVVAMLMMLFCKEKNNLKKCFYIFLVMAILVLGLMLGTRGGTFACGLTFGMSICFGTKKPVKNIVILGAIAIVVFLIALPILPQDMLKRFNIKNMLSGGGSGRTTIWVNYLQMFRDSSLFQMLFGHGRDVPPVMYAAIYGRTYYAHNLFVKTLLEGGVVGLTILMVLLFSVVKKMFHVKNGMILSAWLGFMLGSMFLDMDNMRVFWMLLIFTDLKIKGHKFIAWRGVYGLFDNNTNIQSRKVSKRKYLKRTETNKI